MSKITDNNLRLLEGFRDALSRKRWVLGGKNLYSRVRRFDRRFVRDRETIADAYVMYASLLYDLDCLELDASIQCVNELSCFDVKALAEQLSDLDTKLIRFFCSEEMEYSDLLSSFYHCTVPETFRSLLISLVSEIQFDTTNKSIFRRLHQVLTFLSRLSLENVDKDRDALAFLERNQNASSTRIDMELANQLAPIVRDLLQGVTFSPWGRHGTGSTADAGSVSAVEKTLFLHYDSMHAYAFRKCGWDIKDYFPFSYQYPASEQRWVKLTTVPKNARKRRTIAMETCSQQWVQQLVKRGLYKHICKNVRQIPLFNQEVQRRRACIGSISGYYSTIDLSAASDSVRWDLVKTAFRKTDMLHWLYAARSRVVEYAGVRYPLEMFATMGSAICFPIECIIFYAICVLASRRAHCRTVDCTVYGDDIICPTSIAPEVLDILVRLGFSPNAEKTCCNKQPMSYRESCGGEYLAGVNVTPLKLPRTFTAINVVEHPSSYDCWVSLANAMLDKGFLLTRRYVIKRLRYGSGYSERIWSLGSYTDVPKELHPLFSAKDNHLHTYDVVCNYARHLEWNKGLFRWEGLGPEVVAVPSPYRYIVASNWYPGISGFPGCDYYLSTPDVVSTDQYSDELLNHLLSFLWFSDRDPFDQLEIERFSVRSTGRKPSGTKLLLTHRLQLL